MVTRAPEPVVNRPAFQPNTAPLGHIEYATNISKIRSTRARGRVAIVLIWLSTVASGFGLFTAQFRRVKWQDYLKVKDAASIDAVDKADHLVLIAVLVDLGLLVLAAIAVAAWARRVAKNAIARGARNVSVGRATIGWFIPIGLWWIGFSSVRASVTQLGGSRGRVGLWQGTFFFAFVASSLSSSRLGRLSLAESEGEVTNTLNRILIAQAVSAATFLVAAIFATRAIVDTNRVVSDPPPGYASQAGRVAS